MPPPTTLEAEASGTEGDSSACCWRCFVCNAVAKLTLKNLFLLLRRQFAVAGIAIGPGTLLLHLQLLLLLLLLLLLRFIPFSPITTIPLSD